MPLTGQEFCSSVALHRIKAVELDERYIRKAKKLILKKGIIKNGTLMF